MLSVYIKNGVETEGNHSLSVAGNAPNSQRFEETVGESEVEPEENLANDYNFEEKTSSMYDLDGESLW